MAPTDPPGSRLLELVAVMDRLRRECPWDREQTHLTLVRYLLEESYEAVEAIESGDRDHLREELGDLLLQVVFHARVAADHESAPFDIDDVASGIVSKLVRRHPHVFTPTGDRARDDQDLSSAEAVQSAWDAIKSAEKARASVLDGIPPGLPALSLAAAVAGRAGRARRASGEQGAQLPAAHEMQSLGDALFELAAEAQASGLDPEQALRQRVRREAADVRVREQRGLRDAPEVPG
jgi:XTP/dITP diphosphohydrolase